MTRIFASPLFRLALFAAALLLLPALALLLAEQDWPEARMIVGHTTRPLLLSCLLLAVLGVVLDALTALRTGSSLLRKQRSYLLWCAVAGAGSAMLLAWLNLFVTSWISPAISTTEMLLLSALAGAIMLPAVLIVRLWLAGFDGLSRSCSRLPALPVAEAELSAALLLLAALIGLLGGAVWPERMYWLLWPSPLLLLAALQLLWHESTVFSGLKQGDWSRVLLGAASGILVAAFALAAYRLYGGALYIRHATPFVTLAFAAYGLLCLQLGDLVAEHWRGKSMMQVFQSKKPFPISVVSRKD
ncbi:MAG TPA: hypothetical protein VFR06_05165 [Gallionellaceae bacterium]|nr:hypothetical protein [Gallionellaceae bacterium]